MGAKVRLSGLAWAYEGGPFAFRDVWGGQTAAAGGSWQTQRFSQRVVYSWLATRARFTVPAQRVQ